MVPPGWQGLEFFICVFTVTRAAAYKKNSFPTHEVYGNTKGPELRLITCDG